ncbi:MAG: hydrogenase nickel incorporation protein HypB [Spirochaetia bacterium]|nr:hydrogenase nickel incorporation protein HypB [Spirochaetia bacterium]
MCEDCGCSITEHSHDSGTKTHASHRFQAVTEQASRVPFSDQKHNHSHSAHSHGSNPALSDTVTVNVLQNILSENNHQADHIREHFNKKNIFAVNLMGSPGCGKTSLLEETAKRIKSEIAVLEGDLETTRDADRMKACGVKAHQIQTGSTCHLDAFMIHDALHEIELEQDSILFIENVGNLVCPAAYDTGAHLNAVMLSVPEGDDKVAKYPVIFRNAHIVILSKMDLLEHFDFDLERVKKDFRKLNPSADFITMSTKDESSIQTWLDYLSLKRKLRA